MYAGLGGDGPVQIVRGLRLNGEFTVDLFQIGGQKDIARRPVIDAGQTHLFE